MILHSAPYLHFCNFKVREVSDSGCDSRLCRDNMACGLCIMHFDPRGIKVKRGRGSRNDLKVDVNTHGGLSIALHTQHTKHVGGGDNPHHEQSCGEQASTTILIPLFTTHCSVRPSRDKRYGPPIYYYAYTSLAEMQGLEPFLHANMPPSRLGPRLSKH
jgi:hypothetical protein